MVCGLGGEAHHVTFAEPKAMARKVGDNWCVPLCHKHHMELPAHGKEIQWWALQGIDPIEWATKSWSAFNE